jgi:CRP/FNR family transcriptional regulator
MFFTVAREIARARAMPRVQQELFRLLSADIGRAALLTRDRAADERLAAFLLGLGERFAARGFSTREYRLAMSRGDVGNYLGLAAETVSRLLRRFQDQRLIAVHGRDIELLDRDGLRKLARNILHD